MGGVGSSNGEGSGVGVEVVGGWDVGFVVRRGSSRVRWLRVACDDSVALVAR